MYVRLNKCGLFCNKHNGKAFITNTVINMLVPRTAVDYKCDYWLLSTDSAP
jgi:hypothetical protein